MSEKAKKITNKNQYERFVDIMKTKPDIAQGHTKRPPEEVNSFWEKIATELNSLGPPTKDISNWKKVWSDYKSYVKKKLSANKRELSATGGGPNKEKTFTQLENDVIALLSLKDSVEGIGARSFGVPTSSSEISRQSTSVEGAGTSYSSRCTHARLVSSGKVHNENAEPIFQNNLSEHSDDGNNKGNQPNSYESTEAIEGRRRKERDLTSIELLRKQITMQECYFKEVTKTFQSACESFKDVRNNLKRVYIALDIMSDNQKKEVEEKRRHNLTVEEESRRHNQEIEKILKSKSDYKRHLAEIEIMKLGGGEI